MIYRVPVVITLDLDVDAPGEEEAERIVKERGWLDGAVFHLWPFLDIADSRDEWESGKHRLHASRLDILFGEAVSARRADADAGR
jgi:hypothetical protein